LPENDLGSLVRRLSEERADEDAWRALYKLMWPSLLAANQRRLRGAWMAAEDLTQEVFVRIAKYCNFNHFQDEAGFRGYVRAVSRNVCADYVRTLMRTTELPANLASDRGTGGSTAGLIVAEADLRTFADSLDQHDRRLLSALINGNTISEIAVIEGLSYGNTAVRIHRLRNRLRRLREPASLVKTRTSPVKNQPRVQFK